MPSNQTLSSKVWIIHKAEIDGHIPLQLPLALLTQVPSKQRQGQTVSISMLSSSLTTTLFHVFTCCNLVHRTVVCGSQPFKEDLRFHAAAHSKLAPSSLLIMHSNWSVIKKPITCLCIPLYFPTSSWQNHPKWQWEVKAMVITQPDWDDYCPK